MRESQLSKIKFESALKDIHTTLETKNLTLNVK